MACNTDQPARHNRRLSKDKLDECWTKLSERIGLNTEEEILYFCHCTCIKARRGIISDGVIYGSQTDHPSSAPLASNEELIGTWFSPSNGDLQGRSPYGTQRMKFRADDFMNYLLKNGQNPNSNDSINGTDEATMREDSETIKEPLIFFECAHHYGNRQYARLLLVRASDPMVTWCKTMCKEINLRNNPFLKYRNGRVWSRAHGHWTNVTVDVLVVGDILLDEMAHRPEWDKIGTSRRAGNDPDLGLCWIK